MNGVQVGPAFTWAINKLQQHIGVMVGLAAVVFAIRAIEELVSRALINNAVDDCREGAVVIGENGVVTITDSCSTGLFANIGLQLVLAVVFGALAWLASIGVYRAALRRTQGETPSFAHLTSTENLGAYVIVAVLFGIASFVGLLLCFLPGLVVIFLFQFAPLFALDRGVGVGEAFGSSFRAVTQNFIPVLLAGLVNIVAAVLGSILFGVFTLVTLPFAALFTAHVYRQLNAEPVAD